MRMKVSSFTTAEQNADAHALLPLAFLECLANVPDRLLQFWGQAALQDIDLPRSTRHGFPEVPQQGLPRGRFKKGLHQPFELLGRLDGVGPDSCRGEAPSVRGSEIRLAADFPAPGSAPFSRDDASSVLRSPPR